MKWNKYEIEFLQENYPKFGAKYCSHKLNRPETSIGWKAYNLQLKTDKKYLSERLSKRLKKPNKCKVNPEIFINPNTPESSYILGFLWADGNLGQNFGINTEIVSEDAIILQKTFLSTGNWGIYHRKRENRKPSTKYLCNTKLLYNHLLNLNFNSETKCPLKLLNTIPISLHHYWYRGFFDGDGNLYVKNSTRQLTFAGKYTQKWDFLTLLLDNINIYPYSYRQITRPNKNKYSIVRVTNKNGIIKFCNYIYQGKQFGLSRKHEKYLSIIS